MQHTASNQEISVALSDDIQTLDPRLARTTNSVTIEHMLFDGLMRKNYAGKIVPAVAERVEVSDDGRVYTFHLRDSFWSDGSPVTAHSFEYAWKSMLSPDFPAPNAHQLYAIKGAKAAKLGKASLNEVGINCLDDKTLEVKLEAPTPYFLELTTTHFFSPVNAEWDLNRKKSRDAIVVNGPFMLSEWKKNNEISFVKNPNYWDSQNVRLEKITFVITDETTALQMFERKEIDWAGSPLSLIPPDAIAMLQSQKRLVITPAEGTHWFRINTEKPLLHNKNIRKALALALDRKAIVDHITQANQLPATGIIPPHFALQNRPYFEDHDIIKAWTHFQEGLKELALSKDDLPSISLCHAPSERDKKIAQAVQQQWKKALGIEIALDTCEHSVFIEKVNQRDYDLSFGSWFGDISDPINFLEVFKYKNSKINNTQWESDSYVALLEASSTAFTSVNRSKLLAEAERELIDEMPVIPLYHATFNHLSRNVAGVYFSPLGYLDFTYAFKEVAK